MSNLVLDSPETKNFRAFQHLRIGKFWQVNLVHAKTEWGVPLYVEAGAQEKIMLDSRRDVEAAP